MKIGNQYSRAQIAAKFGGSTRVFAPFANNHTTCICLDLEKNPGAPNIILPKGGPLREKMVDLISKSSGPLPIFIKRGNKAWEYMGTMEFDKISRSKSDIIRHHKKSVTPVNAIIAVIYMK